ncbi:tetratricopeptide repeat protein [Nostoc spongiaeforme FACHB-130]|uniref:Tetratricopeptide repeat protein n=1 Tax=Nostoc spongiaeforme FACHB-130 TaxID=1357510 RepID=A0ABR8FTE3_9NOSO|nr:CHAT domain-containing tetratricopeptide repeat protein [Nostoc spongiaeforme]MBD2594516.1 tetratricopeptide repeat protein [Nostoc spongiaeforme FACHB-130]
MTKRIERHQKPRRFLVAFTSHLSLLLVSITTFAESGVAARDYAPKITIQAQIDSSVVNSSNAEQIFQEGEELLKLGTATSFRQAIAKFETALKLWQQTGNIKQQATTLNELGFIYNALGDKQQALIFFNQSLSLTKQITDIAGQAVTLNNIGGVYDALGDKKKALDCYNQSLSLSQQLGDLIWQAITLNNIGNVYNALGEKQQALKYYNQSLPISRKMGDKAQEAITLNNIGGVYDALGDKQQALTYYSKSLPLSRQVGDKNGQAVTLNNIGGIYDALGDKHQALMYYNQSMSLRRQVGDKTGEAITLNNIAGIYDALGDKQQALNHYNQSLNLSRKVGDKTGQAVTLNNIGRVYDSLADKQQALKYYNQSLPLRRQVGDKTGEATTLNNIGGVYDGLGDKQQALEFYNQSLALSQKVGDRAGEATTLNNLGGIYSTLGDKQQALKYYNLSLPLRRQIGDKTGEAVTLNNIGRVYDLLGDKQQALKYYNQSMPLRRQVGDRTGEAVTLNNIGRVYDSLGEKQEALKYYNQSLFLSRQVRDKAGEATTLNNIGGVYTVLGDTQKALAYYNQSLPLRQQMKDKAGEAITLYNIAYLERNRGNFQESLAKVEAAIKIIENLRTKITNEQLRTSYFASQQTIYEFANDLLMQLHKKYPQQGYDALALQNSEKYRSRSLLELLTEANANIRQGVEPKLLETEQNLQQRLNATEKLRLELYNSGQYTPEQAQVLENELTSLLKEYQEVQAKIRFTSPKYAALTQPQPLSLKEIQQQVLDEETLLLEYALGEERSYLWAVSKNSISSYELPKRAEIEKVVKQFNYLLKIRYYNLTANIKIDASSGLGAFSSYEVLEKLNQMLLEPVAAKIKNKRLVIVGDGALQYLPFSALPQPGTSGKNIKPLLESNEVLYIPSASTLAVIRREHKERKIPPKTLAVIADAVFSYDDERLTRIIHKPIPKPNIPFINPNFSFERLSFTRQEAEGILALVPKSLTLQALDFAANRTFATSSQLSEYRIIHFATHGILDTKNPALSGVVLSLFDEKGRLQNGFLRLQDIFNLKLPAELIVLSACETGLSQQIKGEGLVGLARGFMYAGSPRVLVSLWNVDDEATSQLMKAFYTKILKQELTPAAALREARLELWRDENYSAPYYWAGFTLQGEWK